MCTGAEMMLASAVMGGVGTAVQAVGAMQASSAQQSAYEYQAQVSANNAKLAEWQAQAELEKGAQAEMEQRRKTAALKGTQTATMAARGLDLGVGSPLNILTETDYLGEMDALTIRDTAARNAWAARVQGTNDSNNAQLLKMRAEAENPLMAGAGSLLTGAGAVADRWYKYKTA